MADKYEYKILFKNDREKVFVTRNLKVFNDLLAWYHGSENDIYELGYTNPNKESSKLYFTHDSIAALYLFEKKTE